MTRLLNLLFALSFASTYAKLDDLKLLTKANLLQIMQDAEKLRLTEEIVRDVYNSVVEEATNGKGEFAIEFTGCDNSNVKISKELCVDIVNDVFGIVQTKFPDSIVAYNVETKEFKVSWE
jgi:hypothetical protein